MAELVITNAPALVWAIIAFLGIFGAVSFFRRPDKSVAKKVNWRPLEALGITIFIYFAAYFASQLVLGLGLGLYTNLQHKPPGQLPGLLENSVTVQFFASLLFYGLIGLFTYLFLRLRRTPWAAIGWVRPRLRDIGYAVLGFIVYFLSYMVIVQIVQALVPGLNLDQRQEIGFNTSTTGVALLLVFASLVVLPPLVEEILTRGVLYSGLRTKLPVAVAAVVTSIIFAAAHLQAGSGNALLWVAAIDTFMLSLVLVYLREKTGSLWPSISLHALKNGIAFLVLFVFHLA